MAAPFDAERIHIELKYSYDLLANGSVRCFRARVGSKRILLWRRDSVTSLVPIGYLVQSWIVHHWEDDFVVSLAVVDGDI